MYIADRLRALGVPVTVHEPELYLSIPGAVRGARRRGRQRDAIASRPPSFARSTDGEEVSGELVYVPSTYAGGTADLFDTPMSAARPSIGREAEGDPVAGNIVLTEGYSMPGPFMPSSGAARSRRSTSTRATRSTKGSARRSGERRPTSRSRASRGRRLRASRTPMVNGSRRSRRAGRFAWACGRGCARAGRDVSCRSPRSAARRSRRVSPGPWPLRLAGTSASATTRPVMRRFSSSRACCTPFATASSGRSESPGGPDIRPAVMPARHGSRTHSPTRSTSGASLTSTSIRPAAPVRPRTKK